jgi:hypothetical protein
MKRDLEGFIRFADEVFCWIVNVDLALGYARLGVVGK